MSTVSTKKPALLIVDDEPSVLRALQELFEDDYHVFGALNGQQGLAILREHPIRVIVADERMPEMTGMEFLGRAREINPSTLNIMLTAYSDMTVAIQGINGGLLHRYLLKPWNSEELVPVVRQLFDQAQLESRNRELARELKAKNDELQARIQELHGAQEKLVNNERLTTIGQLSASISHELKNPLGRIKSAASLLRNELTTASNDVQELLRIIDNEVILSTKIINDLLDYSRERTPSFENHQIDPIIDDTLNRIKLPPHVTLERSRGTGIPAIQVDPGQMGQIVVNLIINAVQAMSDNGGKLYVSTAAENGHLIMTVKDTGIGMDPEQLERVFEPLFTTKPKGIGLGMTIVKSLIEKHHGSIHVQSRRNIGTTVTVSLPL
jgi:signal transduction histidine kinase